MTSNGAPGGCCTQASRVPTFRWSALGWSTLGAFVSACDRFRRRATLSDIKEISGRKFEERCG